MRTKDDSLAKLNDRVRLALRGSGHFSRQNRMKLFADRGVVTLSGKVGTFYQKQMAQEIVKTIDGVSQIENQLEVAAWA